VNSLFFGLNDCWQRYIPILIFLIFRKRVFFSSGWPQDFLFFISFDCAIMVTMAVSLPQHFKAFSCLEEIVEELGWGLMSFLPWLLGVFCVCALKKVTEWFANGMNYSFISGPKDTNLFLMLNCPLPIYESF
jgi:hypothetical protein